MNFYLLTIPIRRFLYLYILPLISMFTTVFKVLYFSAAQIEILFFKAPLSRFCRAAGAETQKNLSRFAMDVLYGSIAAQ